MCCSIPQGMVLLASYAPELIGKTPYDITLPWLAGALAGKTTLSNPFKSIVMLTDAQGRLRTGVPTMIALAPVRNDSGEQIAVIAELLHPEGQFYGHPTARETGKSGETYAVDRNGLMLSQSRFDDELKQIGLLTDDDLSLQS